MDIFATEKWYSAAFIGLNIVLIILTFWFPEQRMVLSSMADGILNYTGDRRLKNCPFFFCGVAVG